MAKEFRLKSFVLDQPVRLAPLSGTTYVDIRSNGNYQLTCSEAEAPTIALVPRHAYCATYVPYCERQVTLCQTARARLSRSPQGRLRTVKVILPWEEATEEEFVREVRRLFRKYHGLTA